MEHPQEVSDLIVLRYIRSKEKFICLFVFLLICFLFKSSWDTHRKIRYLGSKKLEGGEGRGGGGEKSYFVMVSSPFEQ